MFFRILSRLPSGNTYVGVKRRDANECSSQQGGIYLQPQKAYWCQNHGYMEVANNFQTISSHSGRLEHIACCVIQNHFCT